MNQRQSGNARPTFKLSRRKYPRRRCIKSACKPLVARTWRGLQEHLGSAMDERVTMESRTSADSSGLNTTQTTSLCRAIANQRYGTAKNWQGAGLIVSEQQPQFSNSRFYSSPRLVVTTHAPQVSWLLERVHEIFSTNEGYWFWKEELFGRLGNVVVARNRNFGKEDVRAVLGCLAIEAFRLARQLDATGSIPALAITHDGHIVDDFTCESDAYSCLASEQIEELLQASLI